MASEHSHFSFADCMGIQLKAEVERQLIEDLKWYGHIQDKYRFDWSDCCIEGHRTKYLDGAVENFSNIMVFDANDELVADGWMEFIHEDVLFIAYWEFLSEYLAGKEKVLKKDSGLPMHIYNQLPDPIKLKYNNELML
ncbi:hypothetical protein [Paenibacillus sp. FSL R7-0179]|uniref:hypothetical protein n=1 Tax=Paenibacillus sp. FSL R7-0179 TaxID=2921672 RepID=UPI0030FCD31C